MKKYTTGKWTAKPATLNPRDPMFYKADVISGGIRVAQVAGVGEENSNANANLISAAPELLTACIYALNELKYPHPNPENKGLTIKYLEQAISKARKE